MDLIEAVQKEDLGRVKKLLIKDGADVNYEDIDGRTALFYARERTICTFLIEQGANVNYKNKYGSTPLIYAAASFNIETTKLLLSNGANVNQESEYGWTALDYALYKSNDYVTNILLWRGAKYRHHINIDQVLLLIYYRILPSDQLREIHTKWIS
jgi:ankyrin repeat protein